MTTEPSQRPLSLPAQVAAAGGIQAWNQSHEEVRTLTKMMSGLCQATTVAEAVAEVKAIMSMGHNLWSYAYMRMLYSKDRALYYGTLLAEATLLLPVVYTPTVGEACQKFGKMPMHSRGCYVSIRDRGNLKKVLEEYAASELEKGPDGKPLCDCIVFSDAGRILGLGDLGAWGMGIPIGKLDLYTVCAGVNPNRTIPVIIDAGCYDSDGNTDKLLVRDHPLYTGLKQDRVVKKSPAGTVVNTAYYGEGNMIEEFMTAATEVFGKNCLLQFEDFNSNDAFPLLDEYRNKFLTYNDDIQGTASVCVAGLLGAVKLQQPNNTNLREELRTEIFLFHGAGSANIGAMKLLHDEVGVPKSHLFVTNSRGVIWKSEDGSEGSFRNEEQKEFAQVGKPSYNAKDLAEIIKVTKATCLIGAVGRDPNCFTKAVVEAIVEVAKPNRPVILALSNPKTQAEITSKRCYEWSGGAAIYGSGTKMESVEVNGQMRHPGQVNNVYIFPGTSMGAICCKASSIPESFFLCAAEAVANSLSAEELKSDSIVPSTTRIRQVGLRVATAVVMEAQRLGLANKVLGQTKEEVETAIHAAMWVPGGSEEVVQSAMAANSKVAAANAAAIQEGATSIARELPVDSEISAQLSGTVAPVRAVKVVVDTKRPRFVEQSTLASTDSLKSDLAQLPGLFQDVEPCGVLVRLQDKAGTLAEATELDWLMVTWVPEGTPSKVKMQWQGSGSSFASQFPEKRVREWKVTDRGQITLDAFLAAAKQGMGS